MECASDTESDGSSPSPSDTVTRSTKGCAAVHDAVSLGAIERAIEAMSEHDVHIVIKDKSHFEESSELLLYFLDRVPEFLSTDPVEVTQIFAKLGTHLFFQKLLDLRKYVRLAERAPRSQSTLVTWIDIVLAKLSLLATPIAIGLATFDLEQEAQWIQLRRADDAIRAATQLPDRWEAMVAVIGSREFSPAARRLATSLCFITYVMIRQITSDKTWPRESPSPLDILHSVYLSINHATCATVSPSVLRGSSVDKVQLAMFVSLFAGAHSQTEPGDITYTSNLRPEGFGHILEIIQIILGQGSSSLCVLERPDPAQYILLRWGNIVPWSWSIWNDQRVANTECLRSLSATWFFLVHPPDGTRHQPLNQRVFGIDLRRILLSDVFSTSLMVLQLLKELLDERNRNHIPSFVTTGILCKLCWASVQYLEANVLESPRLEALVPELCDLLIQVFPITQLHGEEDNLVRSLIIEALALTPIKAISLSLKKILQNKQFLLNLDESMRTCIRLHSDQGGEERDPKIQNYFAKSLLDFSSLITQATIDNPSLSQIVASFVAHISQLILERDDPSLKTVALGSFLTILSLFRRRKANNIKTSDEDVWSLITQGLNQHLSVPAAFAYYLLTTGAHDRDPLLQHEAWGYSLGVLSKIVERQLPEEEEPLALLVAPNICLALRSILGDGITRKRLLTSPWALTLRLSLQELFDNKAQTEPYLKEVQERIRSEGLKLVNELSGTDSEVPDDVERIPRLVYYRDYYQSELVPVYDPE